MIDDPDDGVLAPDELHPKGDDVAELGENRYLVRTGEGGERATPSRGTDPEPDGPADTELPDARLAADPHPHGVEISLKLDGQLSSHSATSTDVREVFVELLTWYADQLDAEMSPEETLRVMLASSEIEL